MKNKKLMDKYVHISIDDVNLFRKLASTNKQSLWEISIFRYCLMLHRLFKVKITLFVYGINRVDLLNDISDRYKTEFETSANWLKIGFHGFEDDMFDNTDTFRNVCYETIKTIERIAGLKSLAKINRQHYWKYSEERVEVLQKYGVDTILLKTEDLIRYRCNIRCWNTHIRIEEDPWCVILKKFKKYKNINQPLVIYTHEWALNRKNKIKLASVIAYCAITKYIYVCE